MSKEWQHQQSSATGGPDPLSGYHGQPVLGQQGQQANYKGRIIIELWETSHSDQIALSVESLGVDAQTLLQRASTALSKRLEKGWPGQSPPS